MKMKFAIIPFIFIAMMLFIASAVVNTISSTTFAQKSEGGHFLAELSGKSIVGTNLSTNATGNAIFTVTEDGNEMSYTVNTMRINHVTDDRINSIQELGILQKAKAVAVVNWATNSKGTELTDHVFRNSPKVARRYKMVESKSEVTSRTGSTI